MASIGRHCFLPGFGASLSQNSMGGEVPVLEFLLFAG